MSEENHDDKPSILKSIGRFFVALLIVIVCAFLLRAFIFQSYEIPSGSMEDTIMTGDLVFAEKVTLYGNEPQKGQIVTFDDPQIASRTLIKRVIATGGETVELQEGSVYIDGVKQDEPYTDGKPSYPLNSPEVTYPYTVPEGCIWVMGDNRTASQDSRYFGAIPTTSVQAHAIFKYWPLDNFGPLE